MGSLITGLGAAGFHVSVEAARDALENAGQFNAIDPESGWKADLIIRRERNFSETEFGPRHEAVLFGIEVALTSIEDLIIAKLEWSEMGDSELHRRDLVELLQTGARVDLEYVEKWVAELGLEAAWRRVRSSQ